MPGPGHAHEKSQRSKVIGVMGLRATSLDIRQQASSLRSLFGAVIVVPQAGACLLNKGTLDGRREV